MLSHEPVPSGRQTRQPGLVQRSRDTESACCCPIGQQQSQQVEGSQSMERATVKARVNLWSQPERKPDGPGGEGLTRRRGERGGDGK